MLRGIVLTTMSETVRVDGKVLAETLCADMALRFAARPNQARLGIMGALHNPVIASFVRIKERTAARLGVVVDKRAIDAENTQEALAVLSSLAKENDGVIVQLPLPDQIDAEALIVAIPSTGDVDGIAPGSSVTPPVALAVEEILVSSGVEMVGKQVVVLGAGRLVGAPSAALLSERGAHVTIIRKGDSLDPLKEADIIVSGAGSPGLVQPQMIREGVALIDAGTSESSGKLVGDIDPACAAKACLYTPVPGGVGPVAVAMIFKNLLDLINQKSKR